MKQLLKKRLVTILLLLTVIGSLVGFFAYYLIRLQTNNVAIDVESSATFEDENLAINFDVVDKFYILQEEAGTYHFEVNHFKVLFLEKLLTKKPVQDEFHLVYQFDDTASPHYIKVTYYDDTKKELFWSYKINN